MGEETTRCICGMTHHTTQMICCDECLVWQHADCMNIDKKKFDEFVRKDLEYYCEKCKPREVSKPISNDKLKTVDVIVNRKCVQFFN